MKKKIVFTALLISLITLGAAQLEVSSVDIAPNNPQVGEEVEISASSNTYGVDYIQAKYPGHSSEWDSRDCSTDLYGCDTSDTEGGSWAFTPDSSGDYTVEIRAREGLDVSSIVERTVTVEGDSGSSLDLVSVSATSSTLSEGESTALEAEVENSGGSTEWVNVEWFAGENRLSSAGGSVSAGVTREFERTLTYGDLEDSGMDVGSTYDLSAEITGTDLQLSSGTIKLESEDSAEFKIDITGTNSPVVEGETLSVDYRIENTGDHYGAQDVELLVDDQVTDTDRARGLGSGSSMTGTLFWPTSESDEGGHTVTVRTEDDSDSREVSVDQVKQGPTLSIDSVSATQYSLDQGDSTTLQATVENSKDQSEWVNVEWFAGDNRVGSVGRSVSAGETVTFERFNSYQDLSDSGLSKDRDYELKAEISGEDISRSSERKITLNSADPTEADFDVEITGTTSPVNEGEILEVDYEIENVGNYYGNRDITLKIDGENKYNDAEDTDYNVDLEPGESEEGSLYWYTGDGDAGFYDVEVSSEDDSDTEFVSIGEGDSDRCGVSADDVSFSVSEKTIDRGDSTKLEVTIYNRGDRNQDVSVEFDSGDDEVIEVDAGESRSVSKTYYPDEDISIGADVSTEGGSCGERFIESFSEEITVLGDDDDANDRPKAEFSVSDPSPEAGERISLDASSSSDPDGTIVDYSWDLGDGSDNSGREITHVYDESGSYPVSLTVEDDDGDEDTAVEYVDVGEEDMKCGISEENIRFSLNDYTIKRGESTEAEITVHNSNDQSQEVEIKFKEGSSVLDERKVTVPAYGTRTVSEEVSPDSDSFIRADVSTGENPCGSKSFDGFFKELVVLQDTEKKASLNVEVEDDSGTALSNARIRLEGPEDLTRFTDSYGNYDFSLEPGFYDVTVSKSGYSTKTEEVRLYEDDDKDLEFELEDLRDDEGTLEVNVEDEDGDRLEDALVEVENGEDKSRRTNSVGFTSFNLHSGRYDVEVSHPDYRETKYRTINVRESEVERETFILDNRRSRSDGITISSTSFGESVCEGGTLPVDVTLENRADRDEYVKVKGKGLGSVIVLDSFTIDEDETEERRVRFTNVEGEGRETFRIQAKNGTRDEVSRSVTVKDCTPSENPTQDPSEVSMKLSYPIAPNKALVGDTVKVSGFVDGVNGRNEVEIDLNGERKARVLTQPDGYYQTYIRADSVGLKTVRANSGGRSASRELQVLPTARVGAIDAPRRIFEGQGFDVCAEVSSQVNAKVLLLENGEVISSTNDRGNVCFDVEAQEPGNHVYEVKALTAGEESSSEKSVEVLKTDVEVESFPSQIASVESGSGQIKLDIYNTKKDMTRYNMRLEGLPSTWLSQSDKQVVLRPGESKEVFFYLTPRDEGDYDPEVVVEARNQEVFRQKVDLETGGQNRPREKSFLNRLGNFLSF